MPDNFSAEESIIVALAETAAGAEIIRAYGAPTGREAKLVSRM